MFIKVTDRKEQLPNSNWFAKRLVNISHIAYCEERHEGRMNSIISLDTGKFLEVTETLDEIAALINGKEKKE